jgi:8-oxo-dGTP pyrophosphatase MutT (NUDIX family)
MRLPIQVEAIIFRRKNSTIEYLLLKRLPGRNGFWQPITGGVEEGETQEETLRREIKEETGMKNLISLVECRARGRNNVRRENLLSAGVCHMLQNHNEDS